MRQRTNDEMRRAARRRRRGMGAVAAALGMLVAAGGGVGVAVATPPSPATPQAPSIEGPATTTLPGTQLQGGWSDEGVTTLFAYAVAGERLVADLRVSDRTGAGARVVVTDPAGVVAHDATVAAGAAAGTTLGGAWSAGLDGVWSVAIHDGPGRQAGLEWDVAVVGAAGSVPGRVWTESLAIHTPEPTTLALHAAAPDGAQYRVTLDGYDGVDSTLRMNDVGNAAVGTCEPALRSVPMPHSPEGGGAGAAWWQPTADDCAGLTDFRLFLDAPAADLPPSTTAWADGRTVETWLLADYVAPTIAALDFARDTVAANAGTLTGTLQGQPGVVRVEVDGDGDGGFDGPRDVVDEVAVLEPGAFSWHWDGLDAAGAPVSPTTAGVRMRATMAQVSPIHFLRIDAETNTGGIEVEALTGPAPGVTTLHWDDTALDASSASRWTRTPALIGSDPATTSAGGVHGWQAGGERPNQNDGIGGSWGDLRAIDDWAFIEDHAQAEVALAALPDLRIDKRVDAEVLAVDDGSAVSVVWTIDVANLGTVDATDVSVTDDYPVELDPASLQVVAGPSQGSFDVAAGIWSVGTLPPSGVASVTLQGTVAPTAGAAATVVNAAWVMAPQAPPPGSCRPNADLESDDDRCDLVETPIAPTPATVAPPAVTTPAAAPAPSPALRDPGRREPLPETGASVPPLVAVGGALALAIGLGALAVRRRARGTHAR
ncbi:DUF11 domain-containing protein [Agrococcus jejuensis]|uniref:DUF11 domain-containing protein n=1 Tax=Agrococcus jejuensis TaxID=399736 RepID=UPI001642629D|nr:DUF11 domain-containing protein [Agrococcus jejuensis]